MKRYKIIGSYSSDDVSANKYDNYNEVTIPLSSDGKFSCFGMDHVVSLLRKNDILPTEKAYDLIALALLIYIADTRISRGNHAQDSWTREIYIELPVEEPELWNFLCRPLLLLPAIPPSITVFSNESTLHMR